MTDITTFDAGPYDALLVNDGLIGNGNYGLNPSRSAARIFYDLLVARGITITGTPANQSRPVDAGFTTLLGAELHSGAMANGELWHILAVGLPEDFARARSGETLWVRVFARETGSILAEGRILAT